MQGERSLNENFHEVYPILTTRGVVDGWDASETWSV